MEHALDNMKVGGRNNVSSVGSEVSQLQREGSVMASGARPVRPRDNKAETERRSIQFSGAS